jgi:tetratricopeptide (TPR) repeat protein
VALVRERKYSDGETEIERGLELGYQDANTFTSLGMARTELGRSQQAIEAYQEALKLDPHFAAANLNLALEYRRLGDSADALRYYRKLCESNEQLCRQYAAHFTAP